MGALAICDDFHGGASMPIGPVELGIILLIILFVFGAGKLPEVGAGLGKSIQEFRTSAGAAEPTSPPREQG